MTAIWRWLRTRTAFVTLIVAWLVLLAAARFGAWESARGLVVVMIVGLGTLSVIVFMQRWGETQDSVVKRDFHRARLAEEAERILEEEDKQAARDNDPARKQ